MCCACTVCTACCLLPNMVPVCLHAPRRCHRTSRQKLKFVTGEAGKATLVQVRGSAGLLAVAHTAACTAWLRQQITAAGIKAVHHVSISSLPAIMLRSVISSPHATAAVHPQEVGADVVPTELGGAAAVVPIEEAVRCLPTWQEQQRRLAQQRSLGAPVAGTQDVEGGAAVATTAGAAAEQQQQQQLAAAVPLVRAASGPAPNAPVRAVAAY